MIKLKELHKASGNWNYDDAIELSGDSYEHHHIDYNHPVIFKGYRFYINESPIGDRSRLYLVLPDRNFIVGMIEFTLELAKSFEILLPGTVAQVHESIIHKRFRGQGLGRLLYEYFAKTYKIILSDHTLFEGSYHLWETMGAVFPGTLFGYDSYSRVYYIYNDEWEDALSYFLFFYNNTYLDKHPKMMEDKKWILENNIDPNKIRYYHYKGSFDEFKSRQETIPLGVPRSMLDLIIVYGDEFRAKLYKQNGQWKLIHNQGTNPNQLSLFDNENK